MDTSFCKCITCVDWRPEQHIAMRKPWEAESNMTSAYNAAFETTIRAIYALRYEFDSCDHPLRLSTNYSTPSLWDTAWDSQASMDSFFNL